MKNVFITFMANIVSLAFAIGAIFLAYHGKDGWGWCILASLMTTVSIKFKE